MEEFTGHVLLFEGLFKAFKATEDNVEVNILQIRQGAVKYYGLKYAFVNKNLPRGFLQMFVEKSSE